MSRAERRRLKRLLAQVGYGLERVLFPLQELHGVFNEPHPEFDGYFEAMVGLVVMGLELTKKFAIQAWGKAPDNWDDWRK